MAIYALGGQTPDIHPDAFVHPEGATVPAGHIALGVPARPRPAPELAVRVAEAVGMYRDLANRYRAELRRIG
ncbi:MAG: hypothetical protein V7603_184 [Micromonosporaceae bacterium]